MAEHAVENLPEPLREAVRDYEDVHTGLGILGNVSFFVGSILFLFEGAWQRAGVWLFIIGSFGMMIGSIGSAIVKAERRRRDEQRDNERRRMGELVRRLEGRPRSDGRQPNRRTQRGGVEAPGATR